MMQEAAFTELINKQSLEQLQMLENENQYHLLKRDRFAPDEVIIKFRQGKSEDGTRPQSYFIYPSSKYYPKNFNTKTADLVNNKKDENKKNGNLCVITN